MTRQNKVKSAKGFGWCRNAKAKLAHTQRERESRQRFLSERVSMIYPTIHVRNQKKVVVGRKGHGRI